MKPEAPAPPPTSTAHSPPSSHTASTPPTDRQSDGCDTAETGVHTVMAEQISHNVVNESESTGSSLPVGVAASLSTQTHAAEGSNNLAFTDAKTTDESASDPNAAFSSNAQATDTAAGPSAGNAANGVAGGTTILPDATGNSELPNGVSDATITSAEAATDNVSVHGSTDMSLHSDTEGSKGDTLEQKGDEKHHARANSVSVKKPATFSKVSVTKNFMAKSTTPTPPTAKLGERPGPAGTPPTALSAAKPRLIAKSGTSLGNVQKSKLGVDGAGGPDASKVWNKNRPVAPPPPKHFTDEELKQQFGIHMTARLQSDETGKDAKWADIDDEEDDWAPEAVVWMDGTKSTLTAQEAAAPQQEQKALAEQVSKPAEATRPILALKKPTVDLGPQKTILKPGAGAAAAQAKQQGAGAGTPLEKPSLKAKSPAPTPSKSPWAVLPPVEKVSPINPPVQQTQPPPAFASQDARAYDPTPPSQPAREIRADTFDRSWRGAEGAPRELYNAANGRYEPAPEGRRASKPDASYRKPAVLQRPSYGTGPAEPSAAFQSRTSGQVDGSGPRRRGSSVSQGSLPPPRRVSMSQSQDGVSERRPSMVIEKDVRATPTLERNEPSQPSQFSQQSAWQQQMPPQPNVDAEPQEDPVKVQERIMREKRELAMKRRQEQEAQDEAQRKERLRARLAGLEGHGKSRKEREAEAAAAAASKSAQTTPATELPHQPHLIGTKGDQPQPARPAETGTIAATIASPATEAQNLRAAPSPSKSQPQQPAPVDDKVPSPLPAKTASGLPERPISSTKQAQRQPNRNHLSPRGSARAPFSQQTGTYRAPTSSYSSPGDRKQQLFTRSPFSNNDPLSSAWPTAAPNSNVWGTSSGIGNGTFESASAFAPIPMSQQNSPLPPPPGMSTITRPSTSARNSPQSLAQGSKSPSLQQQSIAEAPHRGFAPPGLDARPDPFAQQARANGASPAPGLGRQTHLPGPIAPPSRAQQQQQPSTGPRPDALTAWNSAAQRLPYEFRKPASTSTADVNKDAIDAPEDTIKETFKKTTGSTSRLGGPRRYDATEYTVYDSANPRAVSAESPAPPVSSTQPAGPFTATAPLPPHLRKAAAENTVRIPDGSLNPAHGGTVPAQPPTGPATQQRGALTASARGTNFTPSPLPSVPSAHEQSPPPPEDSSHPVNSGNHSHPLVRLPGSKPKPIVRLPPPPESQPHVQQPNQVSMPHRPISTWGAPPGSKPLVMREDWQARFNGLFNRTAIHTETPPSPPKTPPKMQMPAAAVTSLSRATMSEVPIVANAIVSLPQNNSPVMTRKTPDGFTIDNSEDVTSKSLIEGMFMEEQSFGSLPKVTVPKKPVYDLCVYQPLTRNLLNMGSNSKFFKATEAQSKPALNMRELYQAKHTGIYINLWQFKDKNGKGLKGLAYHSYNRQPSNRYTNKGPASKANSNGKDAGPPTGPAANAADSRKTSLQSPKPQSGAQSPAPNTNTAGAANTGSSPATGNLGGKRGGAFAKTSRGGNSRTRGPPPATPS